MRIKNWIVASSVAVSLVASVAALAQTAVPVYGPSVTMDQARKLVMAAEAEAKKIAIPMAIAIVDNAGHLVMFSKMDNTQTASIFVSQDKAVSSATYRRPTKVFQDGLAGGGVGLRILQLRGANSVDGGIPITVEGKIVGGIGVSGGTVDQDFQVAKAGLDGLSK